MPAPTRDRILDTTAELFRRHGYTGTGLKQIVASANAPFGSVYHHFPGGKEQLGEEVIRRSGRMYLEIVAASLSFDADPVTAVRRSFGAAATVLEETGWVDACPIATVALEVSSTSEPLRVACAEVFAGWIHSAAGWFQAAGIAEPAARHLALAFIELLEGAFVLSRAMRTTEPLHAAGEAAAALVQAALPARRPTGVDVDLD